MESAFTSRGGFPLQASCSAPSFPTPRPCRRCPHPPHPCPSLPNITTTFKPPPPLPSSSTRCSPPSPDALSTSQNPLDNKKIFARVPRAATTPRLYPPSLSPRSPHQAEMPEGRGHGTGEQKGASASVRHVMESRGVICKSPSRETRFLATETTSEPPAQKAKQVPSHPTPTAPPSRATPTQAFPGHLPSVKLRHECYTTPPGPARRPAPVKGPTLRKTECYDVQVMTLRSLGRGRSGAKYSDTSRTEDAAAATVDAPQHPTPRPATCSLSRPSLFSDLC